jgi:oligopeptide/dipeptide ABC transporter ATP-binding protein
MMAVHTSDSSPAVPRTDLVVVRGLKVHFAVGQNALLQGKGRVVRAVDGVDLSIARGETLGLVGESGSGKSTLGRAMLNVVPSTAGSVTFDGIDLGALSGKQMRLMRRRMQMIFQDPYASLNPRMNIARIVGEPLDIHGLAHGKAKTARVEELLRLVGLDPRTSLDRYPHEFSGGQRQRIGIARALAVDPELIVADEPISALDVSIQAQIINLLEDLQAQLKLTFLFIAHDLAVVRHISDRIAVMYLGTVVELARRDEFYEKPMHPYTIALLSAMASDIPGRGASRRRIHLHGEIPSAMDLPSGCRFRTRCWLRERLDHPENCATEEPVLRNVGDHEVACHWAERVPDEIGRLGGAQVGPLVPPRPPSSSLPESHTPEFIR